jgi:hypothetical protein
MTESASDQLAPGQGAHAAHHAELRKWRDGVLGKVAPAAARRAGASRAAGDRPRALWHVINQRLQQGRAADIVAVLLDHSNGKSVCRQAADFGIDRLAFPLLMARQKPNVPRIGDIQVRSFLEVARLFTLRGNCRT